MCADFPRGQLTTEFRLLFSVAVLAPEEEHDAFAAGHCSRFGQYRPGGLRSGFQRTYLSL